jgi:hypothetical protein
MIRKNEKTALPSLHEDELSRVTGGLWKRNNPISPGSQVRGQPGYTPPTVISDDGLNILTTDPSTSNVGYDSPFTPIPA